MKPIIVIENIRSGYNVGNIIRTADALGFDVVLSGYTAHPDNGRVSKTSLGAEDYVEIRQYRNTQEALTTLRDEGYVLVAAELTESSMDLNEFALTDKRYAIVVGNEVRGVLPETLSYVDYVVHIPMLGHKDSLNVGQAAAIFMWELGLKN